MKIFEDLDTFWPALPLNENFFLDNTPQQKILIKQCKIYSPPLYNRFLN